MSKSLASALMVVILLSSQSVLMLYSDEMESMDEDSLKLESVSRNIAITDVPTWQVEIGGYMTAILMLGNSSAPRAYLRTYNS